MSLYQKVANNQLVLQFTIGFDGTSTTFSVDVTASPFLYVNSVSAINPAFSFNALRPTAANVTIPAEPSITGSATFTTSEHGAVLMNVTLSAAPPAAELSMTADQFKFSTT